MLLCNPPCCGGGCYIRPELKKAVRGIRPIERTVEGRDDEAARIVLGYCAAVRSALTDDGRPPLEACGWTTAWRGSRPALAGSRKRGAPAGRVEEAALPARQGPGANPRAVAGHSLDLPLGPRRGADPQEHGRARPRGRKGALRPPA